MVPRMHADLGVSISKTDSHRQLFDAVCLSKEEKAAVISDSFPRVFFAPNIDGIGLFIKHERAMSHEQCLLAAVLDNSLITPN